MAIDRLLNVARKEFSDHITSRRFIIILGLLLVISTISIYDGIEQYNNSLEAYTEQLRHMEEFDDPYRSWMPQKPSIMYVFISMMSYMAMLGGILAIAIGFDLVSKEKETRSLKSLLSHPVTATRSSTARRSGGSARSDLPWRLRLPSPLPCFSSSRSSRRWRSLPPS